MASQAEVKTETRKVAVNRCYGGFGLSEAAIMLYAKLKGLTVYPEKEASQFGFTTYWVVPPEDRLPELDQAQWHEMSVEERAAYRAREDAQTIYDKDLKRDDPALIEAIEALGECANGQFAALAVVEVPDDVDWQIEEYDGREWIAEAHRTW